MQIQYEDKKMIVTHPSGHVDIYDETHLQRVKAALEEDRDEAAGKIDRIDNQIAQTGNS